MKEIVSGIYIIVNIKNLKCYVGSSNNVDRRIKSHFNQLRRGCHGNAHLQKSFNKYGENTFNARVLMKCGVLDLLYYEQIFIDKLNPEYNLSKIAGRIEMTQQTIEKIRVANTGKKHSEEHKAKIAYASRNISNETREKISNAGKGRIVKQETRIKLSIAGMGHFVSDENKRKNREAKLGKTLNSEHKQKISNKIKEWWRNRKDNE